MFLNIREDGPSRRRYDNGLIPLESMFGDGECMFTIVERMFRIGECTFTVGKHKNSREVMSFLTSVWISSTGV